MHTAHTIFIAMVSAVPLVQMTIDNPFANIIIIYHRSHHMVYGHYGTVRHFQIRMTLAHTFLLRCRAVSGSRTINFCKSTIFTPSLRFKVNREMMNDKKCSSTSLLFIPNDSASGTCHSSSRFTRVIELNCDTFHVIIL